MEKPPSNFGSFILPKIKVGEKTAMLSNAYSFTVMDILSKYLPMEISNLSII